MKRLFLFLLAALVFQHANAVDVDFYDRLLRVKSVSSDIAQCNEALELTKDYLEKSGVWCRVESNEEGRKALWASTQPGTTADYVIAVHLDVVPAENDMFIPRVKDGKMYARGAIDCKGQVMVALGILKKLNNKSSVGVIFATDEEVGGLTTKMMVERGYSPRKMVLVIDSSQYGVAYAHKGNSYITVRSKGIAGHSSRSYKLINPIERLMEGFMKVRALWPKPTEDGWCDILTPTIVNAGVAGNQVPETAEMVVNLRFVEEKALGQTLDMLKNVGGFEIVNVRTTGLPVKSDIDHPEMRRLLAMRQAKWPAKNCAFTKVMSINDARHFTMFNLPIAIVGAIGQGAHGRNEACLISTIKENIEVLSEFMK
jgi:acetylornithine deacetylase/succinyl-diaminopimelate desuccinylase-like protein